MASACPIFFDSVDMLAAELDAKRLELLLQAVRKARKVGVLDPQAAGFTLTEVQRVAEAVGMLELAQPLLRPDFQPGVLGGRTSAR